MQQGTCTGWGREILQHVSTLCCCCCLVLLLPLLLLVQTTNNLLECGELALSSSVEGIPNMKPLR